MAGLFGGRYAFSSWSLHPEFGEPAHGYFLRLVANEGQPSAVIYANEIGLNGRVLGPEETIDVLLDLPIPDPKKESLKHFSAASDGAWHDLAGQRLRQRQMSFSTRRFCPGCLAQSGHHRAWWDIVSFRTCPDHGVTLHETDEAGEEIGWWWSDISTDTKGNILARHLPLRSVKPQDSLEHLILERMADKHAQTRQLLDKVLLYDVIGVCEFLGRWLRNPYAKTAPAELTDDAEFGMQALAYNLDHLIQCLRSWFTDNVNNDLKKAGKLEAMGWAHIALKNRIDTSEASIWDVIQEASNTAFETVGHFGRKAPKDPCDLFAEKALKPLAEELGWDIAGVIKLNRAMGLDPMTGASWELTSEQKNVVRNEIKGLLTTADVDRQLGLSSWEWRSLVEDGHLTFYRPSGTKRLFRATEVRAVIHKVLSAACTKPGTKSVSLRSYAHQNKLDVATVLSLLMSGELSSWRDKTSGVKLSSLRVIADNRRPERNRILANDAALKLISVGEASVLLGVPHVRLKRLMEIGVLVEAGIKNCLSRSDVMAFHEQYANHQIYRHALGCQPHEVLTLLADLKVIPSFSNEHINTFVERKLVRQAVGLSVDPDHPSVASNEMWRSFRTQVAECCPNLAVPETVPPDGATIRSTNRKLTLDVHLLDDDGFKLLFELDPTKTPRRWEVFERNKAPISGLFDDLGCHHVDEPTSVFVKVVRCEDEVKEAADFLSAAVGYFG
ncbi:TniQ family protein [Rhizobium sp. 'Codium 1']|uniref:TniQ family protein n=1 Tax=Rhizobium sp. 'Codium 1' TaxID=2940484 RepID=UPI001E5F3381|nr:TniQ family protein [Rhizobium sp. 'Codium 1']MCC8934886.1 TniQ family protein [Rhizobium sp. 'Codium 1']